MPIQKIDASTVIQNVQAANYRQTRSGASSEQLNTLTAAFHPGNDVQLVKVDRNTEAYVLPNGTLMISELRRGRGGGEAHWYWDQAGKLLPLASDELAKIAAGPTRHATGKELQELTTEFGRGLPELLVDKKTSVAVLGNKIFVSNWATMTGDGPYATWSVAAVGLDALKG